MTDVAAKTFGRGSVAARATEDEYYNFVYMRVSIASGSAHALAALEKAVHLHVHSFDTSMNQTTGMKGYRPACNS